MTTNPSLNIVDLPLLVQEKILTNFSYTELSRLRLISKHFHELCAEQLNRGYDQLKMIIHDLQQQIKAKLPRRESERRNHPLSTKFDIISSLDSQIQYLKLIFGSSMQNSLFCFYPGQLLDEIYSVLRHLKTQQSFANVVTVLQETRDMSSMAIEHFREHIEPNLQRTRSLSIIRTNLSTTLPSASVHHRHQSSTNRPLRRRIELLNQRLYKRNLVIKYQRYQMRKYKLLLQIRTKSLLEHHERLTSLEKKSKEAEQNLLEIRNDNDTLLQRFDQFMSDYGQTIAPINHHSTCDEPCSPKRNLASKRRKLE